MVHEKDIFQGSLEVQNGHVTTFGDATKSSGCKHCIFMEKICPSKSLPPHLDAFKHTEKLKEIYSNHQNTHDLYLQLLTFCCTCFICLLFKYTSPQSYLVLYVSNNPRVDMIIFVLQMSKQRARSPSNLLRSH